MTHYHNDSATKDWLVLSAELRSDKGHNLQLVGGRWVIDGMASVASFGSALELVA
jgi:hypothetical protein